MVENELLPGLPHLSMWKKNLPSEISIKKNYCNILFSQKILVQVVVSCPCPCPSYFDLLAVSRGCWSQWVALSQRVALDVTQLPCFCRVIGSCNCKKSRSGIPGFLQ
jgi:hypothetical protein